MSSEGSSPESSLNWVHLSSSFDTPCTFFRPLRIAIRYFVTCYFMLAFDLLAVVFLGLTRVLLQPIDTQYIFVE